MFFVGKKQGLSNTEIVSTLIKLDLEMIWLEGYLSEKKKSKSRRSAHQKTDIFILKDQQRNL